MPNLYIDVQPSRAILTIFLDGNWFFIASTVGCIPSGKWYSACRQTIAPTLFCTHYMTAVAQGFILLSLESEQKQILTWGSNSRCHGEIRQFQSPSLPVWTDLSVTSVSICKTQMWKMNLLCKLTIVIPQLPCLFSLAKAVSSTIDLVNSITSNSVSWFIFAMRNFASKCFCIALVPCSDGWWRTWWQIKHMTPRLWFSSIPLWQ